MYSAAKGPLASRCFTVEGADPVRGGVSSPPSVREPDELRSALRDRGSSRFRTAFRIDFQLRVRDDDELSTVVSSILDLLEAIKTPDDW